MKNQGFTLIELLAVIVILAIISLIATPIILNIIDDSKESSDLRSADSYLDATEMSLAHSKLNNKNIPDGTYNIKDGDICLNADCSDKLEVDVNGEAPKSGSITIANGNISASNMIINEKEITKNSKGEVVYVKFLEDVCTYVNNGVAEKTMGAKYECIVDPERPAYTFYVLTTPKSGDTTINLIMDQNINSDGTPAGTTRVTKQDNPLQYNLVEWINNEDYLLQGGSQEDWDKEEKYDITGSIIQPGYKNIYGPITAMNFLSEATKNWTNINELTIDSFFCEYDGNTYKMKTYYTYARLPIYLDDSTKTEVGNKLSNSVFDFLYENLGDGLSYWTNVSINAQDMWAVSGSGHPVQERIYYKLGVRPVISLKLNTN